MIQAEEKEKNYSWNLAVDFYRKAASLALRKQQFKEAGDIHLRIGYCLFRSAFQAETKEDFKRRMRRAGDSYTKGADLFRKSGETTTRAEINDCKAMSAYIDSWLAPNSREKRKQFQECWRLEQETLNLAERSADKFSVGKTCNNLMMFLASLLTIEWDAKSREKIIDEALAYGENAVEIFSNTEEKSELAKAYTLASFFHRHAAFARGFKADKREESRKKALTYPGKAIEISEKLEDAYLLGQSRVF
jgi:tetratricopeptide (TPR) repeat protein